LWWRCLCSACSGTTSHPAVGVGSSCGRTAACICPRLAASTSITALSAMHHFVSGMNFLKNFANILMMSPCHCHLIFLSPVYRHHHHNFHYASLHLCSTPHSKLTFSINHSHNSLPRLFGLISRIFFIIFGHRPKCSSVFVLFLFSSVLFDSCYRLSLFNQFLHCTLNPCTFLPSFPPYYLSDH